MGYQYESQGSRLIIAIVRRVRIWSGNTFAIVTSYLAGIFYQLNSTCVRSEATKKAFAECWNEAGINHLLNNHKDNYTEKENAVLAEVFKRMGACVSVKMGYIDEYGRFNESIFELINKTVAADDKTADTIYLENMKCFKKYPNNTKSGPINILHCCNDNWKKVFII
ncbi:hypothetical protein CHUAL_005203 [Chamberlinius hualienensis]